MVEIEVELALAAQVVYVRYSVGEHVSLRVTSIFVQNQLSERKVPGQRVALIFVSFSFGRFRFLFGFVSDHYFDVQFLS